MAPKPRGNPVELTYVALDAHAKRQIVTQRIAQLEAEHYQRALAAKGLRDQVGGTPQQQETRLAAVAQLEDEMGQVAEQHASAVAELEAL